MSKTATAMSVIENLPPGNAELRNAIARRYAQQGITISPDDIVITAGALEALNLSLQAVTERRLGDCRKSLFLRRLAGA